jgi:hypothetical protein
MSTAKTTPLHEGETRNPPQPRAQVSRQGSDNQLIYAERPLHAKAEMSHSDAMAALNAGTLKRSVLTEKGWVVPS